MFRIFFTCRPLIAGVCALSVIADPIGVQAKSAPKLTAPTTTQSTTTAPPPSMIGTSMTSAPTISPLSPQIITTPLTGGTVRPDKLPSPTPASGSPSETAQSTAGGGGWSAKDCMGYWDAGAHMSKSEWRASCERSQRRLDYLKVDGLALGLPNKTTPKSRTERRASSPEVMRFTPPSTKNPSPSYLARPSTTPPTRSRRR